MRYEMKCLNRDNEELWYIVDTKHKIDLPMPYTDNTECQTVINALNNSNIAINSINIIDSLERGDIVLIQYSEKIKKVSTFIEKEENNNLFQDFSGMFILTDKCILNNNIVITKIEIDNMDM